MKENVITFLKKAQVGEPARYKNLAVYPIRMEGCEAFHYIVLGEAIAEGEVKISEVGGSGHVPELFVTNSSANRVFMMDGEELIGAKQNRILNVSIMLAAGCKIKVPVSCVEQGRWHSQGDCMAEGGISYSELRREKTGHVHKNLKAHKSFAADQGAVWNCVSKKLDSMNVPSCTESMHDVFKAKGTDIRDYVENIRFIDGCNGVVTVINNRIVCADLFDTSATLKNLWNKLISSYALDAMEVAGFNALSQAVTGKDVLAFLSGAEKARFDAFDSPGIGKDVRFEGDGCVGSALVCEDKVIHLAMFRTNGRDTEPDTSMARPSRRFRRIE